MGVEREVERRETDETKRRGEEERERDERGGGGGGSETTEGRRRRVEMSDGGRGNKKRCIGIKRGGEKISYGWCRRETRGFGRAQQGCTLHLSVQLLHCVMYYFLWLGAIIIQSAAYEKEGKQRGRCRCIRIS